MDVQLCCGKVFAEMPFSKKQKALLRAQNASLQGKVYKPRTKTNQDIIQNDLPDVPIQFMKDTENPDSESILPARDDPEFIPPSDEERVQLAWAAYEKDIGRELEKAIPDWFVENVDLY